MSLSIGAKTAQQPLRENDVFQNADFLRNLPKYRDAGPFRNERDALNNASSCLRNAPHGTTIDIFVRSWDANNRDFYVVPRDLKNPNDTAANVEALRVITGNYYVTPHATVTRHGNQIVTDPVIGRTTSVPVRDMR